MSDVFREVDEDLRHENLTKMWNQFGPYLIGAAILVVVVVAGYKGWNWYVEKRAAQAGVRFEQAVANGQESKFSDAINEFQSIIGNAPGEYPELARLSVAGLKAKTGDKDGAVADLDAISSNSSTDPEIADLARIQAAMILLDTADRAIIVERLSGLVANDGPWKNSALEILALAEWRAGNIGEAANLFRQIIADVQAPRGVRQRSQVLLALITPDEPPASSGSEAAQ